MTRSQAARLLRSERGVQAELAKTLGVSPSLVSEVVGGTRKSKVVLAAVMARAEEIHHKRLATETSVASSAEKICA